MLFEVKTICMKKISEPPFSGKSAETVLQRIDNYAKI